jgi:PAS domain-containing protein
LLSVVLAAIAGTCTAAMSGHGMVPVLVPDALDAIRARWLSWMTAQITLSTAMSAARQAAAHATALSRDSQAMLRALPEVAYRADAQGRWTWLSPAWHALTGRADATGQPMAELFAPAQRSVLADALAQGTPALRLALDDDEQRMVEISLAPMAGGITGIIRDVSQHAALLDAARAEGADWHALCDAVPVGIAGCDAQGTIVYANWAAELTALAGQARLLGGSLRAWLADDPAFAIAALEARLTIPGAHTSHELKVGRLSLWVVVTGRFDAAGRRTGYVVAVADISARKPL